MTREWRVSSWPKAQKWRIVLISLLSWDDRKYGKYTQTFIYCQVLKTDYLTGRMGRHCVVLKHLGTKIALICQNTDVGKRTPAVVFPQLFADVLVLRTNTNCLPLEKTTYFYHQKSCVLFLWQEWIIFQAAGKELRWINRNGFIFTLRTTI